MTRDFLWWNHVGRRAIRIGDWKLVALSSSWEGRVVDAARIAAGELVNQVFHALIEELYIASVAAELKVNVLAGLIFRERFQLIANTHAVDDVGVSKKPQLLAISLEE